MAELIRIAIEIMLGIAALVAVVGYVRIALDPFGSERDGMPPLLIAFILALGFIALVHHG